MGLIQIEPFHWMPFETLRIYSEGNVDTVIKKWEEQNVKSKRTEHSIDTS